MSRKKSIDSCVVRGCGNMPYVGSHPGTIILFFLVLLGAIAGTNNGFYGAIFGALVMALFIGPIYLIGAYERARHSDRLAEDSAHEAAMSGKGEV